MLRSTWHNFVVHKGNWALPPACSGEGIHFAFPVEDSLCGKTQVQIEPQESFGMWIRLDDVLHKGAW